jgi:hypothetical protein
LAASKYDHPVLRLSAIVPATDEPPTLEACLTAIESADRGPEEVIVARSEPPRAGPAAARNAGATQASGDVLVFVDSDVAVHSDAFTRIRDAFDRDPGLSAVFGSYDTRPAGNGTVSSFRNLLHHHVHQSSSGPAQTFWAGLGAIRREAFLAAGGFDTDRFGPPSVEDVELGLRLAGNGTRLELDPGLLGTHHKTWTLKGMVLSDLLDRGVPWISVLLRRRSFPAVLNLGWRHRASAAACLAASLAAVTRRPRGAAAAAGTFVLLNRSFYGLLLRERGPRDAVAGVALHFLHHMTGLLALPVGAAALLRGRLGVRPSAGRTAAPSHRLSLESLARPEPNGQPRTGQMSTSAAGGSARA